MKRKILVSWLTCLALVLSIGVATAAFMPVPENFVPETIESIPYLPNRPQIPNYSISTENNHLVLKTDWSLSQNGTPSVYILSEDSISGESTTCIFKYDANSDSWISDTLPSETNDMQLYIGESNGKRSNSYSVTFDYSTGEMLSSTVIIPIASEAKKYYYYRWNFDGTFASWSHNGIDAYFDNQGKLTHYEYIATDGTVVGYSSNGTLHNMITDIDGVQYFYDEDSGWRFISISDGIVYCEKPEALDMSKYPPLVPGSQPQPTEPTVELSELTLPADIGLISGETLNVTVNCKPTDIQLPALTWSSSAPEVASVSDGVVTAHSAGTVTITVTCGSLSDSMVITVYDVLTHTVLPDSLITIEAEAFMNSNQERVTLPSGCKSIGSRAFAGNANLVRVHIPASVTSIAEDAFDGCAKLTISGEEGSNAQTFAEQLGIPFKAQ